MARLIDAALAGDPLAITDIATVVLYLAILCWVGVMWRAW